MNIILVTTDHMRYDNIAANGNPSMITPVLDKLCAEGTAFDRCMTPSPVCQPARAALFTGRYPSICGMRQNGIILRDDEITLPAVLAANGYYCGSFGKCHFIPHKERNHRAYHPLYGFHEMKMSDEPGCYDDDYGQWLRTVAPDVREFCGRSMPGKSRSPLEYYPFGGTAEQTHGWWTATEAIRFIKDNRQRNFFCNIGFYNPHPPLMPPQDMLDLYQGRELKPRVWQEGELDAMPAMYRKAHDTSYSKMSEAEWTEYRRYFYAMVSDVDRNMGRLMAVLEEEKLLDDTLIIFTSDHGDYLGDHGLANKGHMCYDQVIRVPLVMRGPGVSAGRRSTAIVELTDLMPTIVKACGAAIPDGVQGLDILPAARGETPGRDAAYCEFYSGEDVRILTTASLKYAIHSTGEEVLFDLVNDPDELTNLAAEEKARKQLDEMRKRMLLRTMQVVDPLPLRTDWY